MNNEKVKEILKNVEKEMNILKSENQEIYRSLNKFDKEFLKITNNLKEDNSIEEIELNLIELNCLLFDNKDATILKFVDICSIDDFIENYLENLKEDFTNYKETFFDELTDVINTIEVLKCDELLTFENYQDLQVLEYLKEDLTRILEIEDEEELEEEFEEIKILQYDTCDQEEHYNNSYLNFGKRNNNFYNETITGYDSFYKNTDLYFADFAVFQENLKKQIDKLTNKYNHLLEI